MPDALAVLRARLARGGAPPFDDGARLGLAIEGGAMRGVISAGMVAALEAKGAGRAFDAVYGSSAGAINGAYFLAGQARLGARIYYEDINNARFIDLRRALAGRPIVDLGYLLDEVAVRRKPLDTAAVLRSPAPLSVIVTDLEHEVATVLRDFPSAKELMSALRASATMPVVAGPPHLHADRRFLDASLSEPIPVVAAVADGCTHVVVLLTRGGGMRARASAFDRWFVAPRLRRVSATLAIRYLDRAGPYGEMIRTIDTGRVGIAEVSAIRVSDLHISKLERRTEVLRAGAAAGEAAVERALSLDSRT